MADSPAMDFLRRLVLLLISQIQNLSGVDYWEQRVKIYGKRSVLHDRHSEAEMEAVTDQQKQEIFPYFLNSLEGDEKLVLDFGCGPGRFTSDLAVMIEGKAVGVDVTSALLAMAPLHQNVEYKSMVAGIIPLPDKSVDIVWICLVLGGIAKPSIFEKTISEIDRVLKSGGLLFLVENTAEKQSGKHWVFRSFEDYRRMFSFVSLTHLHDYFDLGERISIMAGRK